MKFFVLIACMWLLTPLAFSDDLIDTVGNRILVHHPSGDTFSRDIADDRKNQAMSAVSTTPVIMAELAITGLSLPTELESIPGDDRLFVTELQSGKVTVIQPDKSFSTFIDMGSKIAASNGSGLYSITFHPSYATNGYFYLYYTEISSLNLVIERFQVSPDSNVADTTSGQVIFRWGIDLNPGHVGGKVQFHPDGTMWMFFGEARMQDDVINPDSYAGKILRIDPDNPDTASGLMYSIPLDNPFFGDSIVLNEIVGTGNRNPWRWCFDNDAGEVKIYDGDVGESLFEELNILSDSAIWGTAPDSSIWPLHLGWPLMEGPECTISCDTAGFGLTLPAYHYEHADTGLFTGRSITAGYVYRGSSIPSLQGKFVFGDFIAGKVWTYHIDSTDTIIIDHTIPLGISQHPYIVSFGRDGHGEMYIVDYVGGKIYKIIPWSPPASDCNNNFSEDSIDIIRGFSQDCNDNGIPDECDIANGTPDDNSNGIPDECEACCNLPGDIDNSGELDISDLTYLVAYMFGGGPASPCIEEANVNGAGDIDISDLTHLIAYMFGGGPAPAACP